MNLAAILADLTRWEGRTNYLYRDSRGFVTIGVGNLVATAEDCAKLPLRTALGAPAPESQKRAAWNCVEACPPGRREAYYANASELRMTDEDVDALAFARLEREFLPGLRRLYPDYDDLPTSAQSALMDMIYNLGSAGLGKFTHLRDAVNARDWTLAAAACRVSTSRQERNDWRAAKFREAIA